MAGWTLSTCCITSQADDEYGDDAKLIGVYRSEVSARAAMERLGVMPGFCHNPAGFHLGAYRLDEDHWAEGFITE